jgi:hypothetical protein
LVSISASSAVITATNIELGLIVGCGCADANAANDLLFDSSNDFGNCIGAWPFVAGQKSHPSLLNRTNAKLVHAQLTKAVLCVEAQ